MPYVLKLQLKKTTSSLALLRDGDCLAVRQWPEARDMGRQVFEGISGILKEHQLKPDEIADVVVESELPDVYTSARIAETVKKVYAFGVKQKESS